MNTQPCAANANALDSVLAKSFYEARGCEYNFEDYGDDGFGDRAVIVYCWGRDGSQVWSASTSIGSADTVLAMVRAARNNVD